MRHALLATVLLSGLCSAAAAHTIPAAPTERCASSRIDKVEARQPARVRKLADMPPGKQLLGVFREVDGCPTPMIVRETVGMPGR